MSDKNKLKYQTATKEDDALIRFVNIMLVSGLIIKNSIDCKKFHKIKDRLSFNDELLFFGDKLVVI